MTAENTVWMDIFCTALDMKEKKRALYDQSMNGCSASDDIGRETFGMLRDAEAEHARRLQEVYEEMKKGKSWGDACKYYPDQAENVKGAFNKIVTEHSSKPDACVDQVAAIETGMELEDASISFFEEKLAGADDPAGRRFIENIVMDEREHYRTLADLKLYYTDAAAWFMEKSGARLDGAGGGV